MQPLVAKSSKDTELFFELLAFIPQLGPNEMHDAILYNFELFTELLDYLLALFICVLALLLGHVKELLRPVAERVFLLFGAWLTAAKRHEVADECFDDIVESVVLSHDLQFLHN